LLKTLCFHSKKSNFILGCTNVGFGPYSAALAELVNKQYQHPFAANWGDGTTSSSDGQRFKAGGHAERTGQVNLKYGTEPGVTFYTHISDQYAPFHTKVVNVGIRDATYVALPRI